jgi:Ca2+/Na+ antiporter
MVVAGSPPIHGALAPWSRTAQPIHHSLRKENTRMLMTIAILLLVLYALGLVTSYTMGGLIHILLVAAVVIVLVRLIQGRPVA